MTESTPNTRSSFPWWIVGGAVFLAAAYLPTLAMPFDFLDDGNLVYPTRGLSFAGHVALWWEKVVANVNHLGPWRPALWAHWEVLSNLCDENALAWRLERLLWCGLSAGLFLALLRDLKIPPVAALAAVAIGMWNPYRNEVWLSLTLAEGVAMPYALLALIAARRASQSPRPWMWEAASVLSVLMALGCKNTFAALVPAQILLRMWPDGLSLCQAWKQNGPRSLLLAVTLIVPVAHFVYFVLNWHEGQYRTTGLTAGQTVRLTMALKGAIGLDYLAVGFTITILAILAKRRPNSPSATTTPMADLRVAVLTGGLLLGCGLAVYLPLDIISGRYTMPAVWGLDILVAVMLTRLLLATPNILTRLAWLAVGIGIIGLLIALLGKQEKSIARANVLWDAVNYVEQTAPHGSRMAWIGGDRLAGDLDIEEGIHFRWHLMHRGRMDVTVGLFDTDGQRVERVEIKPLDGKPDFRITARPGPSGWAHEQTFRRDYRQGRKSYSFDLERRAGTDRVGLLDPSVRSILHHEFMSAVQGAPSNSQPVNALLASVFFRELDREPKSTIAYPKAFGATSLESFFPEVATRPASEAP